jgi:hypothetical protein
MPHRTRKLPAACSDNYLPLHSQPIPLPGACRPRVPADRVRSVVSFCCAATLPRVHPPCTGRDWGNWLRARVQTEWIADDSRSRLCTGCLSRFGQLLRDRIAERSRRSIGDEVATGDPQCLAIRQWSSRGSICAECGCAGCEPGRVWNAHIDRSRLPRRGQTSCERTHITVVLWWRGREGRSHVQRLLLTEPACRVASRASA